MNAIKGRDVLMYVEDAILGNILFACGTDCTFESTMNLKEVTHYQSGSFQEFEADLIGWVMNCSGLLIAGNTYTYDKIIRDHKIGLKILVTFTVNDGGNFYNITGYAIIQKISLAGPNKQVATYSCSLVGSGSYSISSSIPPSPTLLPMYRKEFGLVAEGVTYVEDPDLVGATLIGLFRGGPEVMTIITSGSPGALEVKFTSALGRIDFGTPIYPGGERVTAQYRPS